MKKTNQLEVFPQLVKEVLKKSRSEYDPNLAVVTTAVALNSANQKKLAGDLSSMLKRQIKIENVVDEDIVGGLHIRIGDKVIDMSLRSKIGQMAESLEK